MADNNKLIESIPKMFDQSLTDPNPSLTRGYNMAFGVLSKDMLKKYGTRVIEVLMRNSLIKGNEADDAETR